MKIKDYPQEIQNIVNKRHLELYGKFSNPEKTIGSSLEYDRTPEGYDFWNKIDHGNIDNFYKVYPKKENIINLINQDSKETKYKMKNNKGEEYEIIIRKL